ncbi:hypothetical protein [Candidatus Palauibacter sp.]|uniref:hypothetical protein n=1 Tax=Candidatus Palauibacter sp. TaxID=3101350 RepID=UPI003B017975
MTASRKTLLAKLAPQFSVQTENVAVEALGHILSGSKEARSALADVLNSGGADLGHIAQVDTQVTGREGERPDLVGFDRDGEKRLLIEAKFWAGLTESQPVAYLKSLTVNGPERQQGAKPSALLFVAPLARLDSLWAELCRQVSMSEMALGSSRDDSDGLRSATVDDGAHMLLTSWTSLLDRMATKVAHAADSHTEADLRQLRGLCEREDGEAFLPLRSEEFALEFPRRMLGLQRLVGDATNRGVRSGFIDVKGLNVTPRSWGYGRYLRLADEQAWFGVSFVRWARTRPTPLWLWFAPQRTALEPLRNANPPELFDDRAVPIDLPVGREYEAVLDAVVERLKEIATAISSTRSDSH